MEPLTEPSFKAGAEFRNVFNPYAVRQFAKKIKKNYSSFKVEQFSQEFETQFKDLKLMERSNLITDLLDKYLPQDFPTSVGILIKSLDPELTKTELTGFEGFITLPQCDYIARNGMDNFEISMDAFYELTKRFSAESAMRSFIVKYEKRTLAKLTKWTQDKNVHVRRLCSECTRPRLPWTMRLPKFQKDPSPVLKILELLKEDDERYVQRSVANNLNDIAKDNPDVVVKTLQKWKRINNSGTQWLIKHAARTLLKQGNPGALALLGYNPKPQISVSNFTCNKERIKIGDVISFSFTINPKQSMAKKENLMIDYIIHFTKANGKQAPKVFKLSKKTIEKNESIEINKFHSFKIISTRKFYPGKHTIELQINGQSFGKRDFMLER